MVGLFLGLYNVLLWLVFARFAGKWPATIAKQTCSPRALLTRVLGVPHSSTNYLVMTALVNETVINLQPDRSTSYFSACPFPLVSPHPRRGSDYSRLSPREGGNGRTLVCVCPGRRPVLDRWGKLSSSWPTRWGRLSSSSPAWKWHCTTLREP